MVKFSIIIPHKNSFPLLLRCVESIPVRSDVEIIIVDDCSDPSVVSKSELIELKRSDVKVIILEESRGAGYARNIGIDNSSGEWLIFSDCDDLFDVSFDQALDDFSENIDDIIFLGVKCVDEISLSEVTNDSFEYYKKNLRLAKDTGNTNVLRYSMNPPWGKFIKKSLVDKYRIRFDELPVANDLMFSLITGFYATSVCVSETVIYKWVITPNSLSTLRSLDKCDCHLDVAIKKNVFLHKHDLDEYRVNLFKMIKLYKGKNLNVIFKTLCKVLKYTNKRYLIEDFISAIQSYVKGCKSYGL